MSDGDGWFLVFAVLWLVFAQGFSLSVWVSKVVQNHSGQILASDVYSNLSLTSTAVSIQAWMNIPSQNITSVRQLLSIQPSEDSLVMIPTINMVNSSHAAIELSTTMSGNNTEAHIFPYPLMFNEWLFLNVVIISGRNRNITTTMMYPDGTVKRSVHLLKGAILKTESSYLMMTTRHPSLPAAYSFLAYLAIADHALGYDDALSAYGRPPDQVYSNDTACGGQIFERSFGSLKLSCSRPGFRLTSIQFASFGRPHGVYPNFKVNPRCHTSITIQIVAAACIGAASCNLKPDTATFSDPCPGYQKNLAILAICSPGDVASMQSADLSLSILSPLDVQTASNNLQPVQFAATQPELLQGANVSLQVVFNGPTDDYAVSTAILAFKDSFCTQFNTTSDRLISPSLRPLRLPIMLLTFTLLPPTTLFDSVSAEQLAHSFSKDMQQVDAPLRQNTILAGASQPPVPITIVDVNLRLCNGEYVYVQKAQDPCRVASAATHELSSLSPVIVASTVAAGALFISIAIALRFKFARRLGRGPSEAKLKDSEKTLTIAVSMPPAPANASSPSSFTVVKSNVGDRPVSQPSKLSIRNLPMRIDRLAAIAKQSYQATDSETDSAFLSDFNNLSIESGPARVDLYFTDSS